MIRMLILIFLITSISGGCRPSAPPATRGDLTSGLLKFLKEDDWNHDFKAGEDQDAVYFMYTGKQGQLSVTILVHKALSIITIYSRLDLTVDPERRAQVAEFLHRANYGLLIGNFELDFRDGEVRYKSSIDLEGLEATNVTFRNLLHANLSTADRYQRVFRRLVMGEGLTPEQAILQAEGPGLPGGP